MDTFTHAVNESGFVESVHTALIPTTDRELRNIRREFEKSGWTTSDVSMRKMGWAQIGTLEAGQTQINWSLRTRYAPASWEITHATLTAKGRERRGL